MPTIDGASLNGLLSSPLVPVAGVLAAVVVMLLVMTFRRAAADGARRLLLPIVVVVLAGARGDRPFSTAWRRTSARPSAARWRNAAPN